MLLKTGSASSEADHGLLLPVNNTENKANDLQQGINGV